MKPHRLPTLFQRLLLSHLLLLCAAFLAAVFLFLHLFAPGVRMFLEHTPLLLIPVLLFLLLIAGVLSAWLAAVITAQLEDTVVRLERQREGDAIEMRQNSARLEEMETFAERLRALIPDRGSADGPPAERRDAGMVHAILDRDFKIVSLDPEQGGTDSPGIPAGMFFLETFCSESYRESVSARISFQLAQEHRITDIVTRTLLPDGNPLTMIWNSIPGPVDHPDFGDRIHLLGLPVREG